MSRPITEEELSAAKRLSEAVNLHVHAQLASGRETAGFIAVRLADGRACDGELYDDRKAAAWHNRNETGVFFVKIGADTMPVNEALIVLQQHRQAYRTGHRFVEEDLITPQRREQLAPFIPSTIKHIGGITRG